MQATVLMLIALGGLGCQNPASDLPPIPPASAQPVAPEHPATPSVVPPSATVPASEPAPPPYPVYSGGNLFGSRDPSEYESFGDCVRDTICSFFIGRSPDVPSAREIEAAYRGGYYSR